MSNVITKGLNMKKNTSPDNLRCCLFANLLVLLVGPLSFARPFLVSATRDGGRVTRVEIIPETGGLCKLANPFDGDFEIKNEKPNGVNRVADEIQIQTVRGQRVILIAKNQ